MLRITKDRRGAARSGRRGALLLLLACAMVVLLWMVAFAVDMGYIVLVKTELQAAADAAALAAIGVDLADQPAVIATAQQYATWNHPGHGNVLNANNVVLGTWDMASRTFTPGAADANAVRVTLTRTQATSNPLPLMMAAALGVGEMDLVATATARVNPRDIAFVIDLSGSMNNDTEPCWATDEINGAFASLGYPTIGTQLMEQVYSDFGLGPFPGPLQSVGQPLGVVQDYYAYAELTKNNGPLSQASIPSAYRISSSDSEILRKEKAYKWMMDFQIAVMMPNVVPFPNTGNTASVSYWTEYLDYIIRPQQINSHSSKGWPRPASPVWLPPYQNSRRLDAYGNPYFEAFDDADKDRLFSYFNKIGYRTYVQFMMDFGRDREVTRGRYTPLSIHHPSCPRHNEATAGGTFSFPPREQPMHAMRRAVIAGLQLIKERNSGITDPNQCDWVSIVAFDKLESCQVVRSLTHDYDAAMASCTTLQAVADDYDSTASERGLILAKAHIASPENGGMGRSYSSKVVILLTDGIPNLYSSNMQTIDDFLASHVDPDWYSSRYPENAALMQILDIKSKKWQVFPVGVGLACDYGFMDRAARMGATADEHGHGPRGSGNPVEYEERLTDLLQQIITNPRAKLVQ